MVPGVGGSGGSPGPGIARRSPCGALRRAVHGFRAGADPGAPEAAQEAPEPSGALDATETHETAGAAEAADAPDAEPAAEEPPVAGDPQAAVEPPAAEPSGSGPDPSAASQAQGASAEETGADDPASAHHHDEHPVASYVLRVNGADRPVTDAWIGESLLYVLRERLGLAGAKDGCSQGECGACNVQVDGRLVASCLVPAVTAAGSEVRTVEGLAVDGRPSDVQRALAKCGAVQCGFCVPGMAMTVHDLLEGNPAPTELEARQALCGNLCRCSGYRGSWTPCARSSPNVRRTPRPSRRRTPTRPVSRTRRAPERAASTPRRSTPGRAPPVRPGRRPGVSNEAATATTAAAAAAPEPLPHGLGVSLPSADARAKTEGTFPYAADLWAEGLLWAAVLRSPHPHARILSIDTTHAREMPGVRAVVTHEDVPGQVPHGRGTADRPVFASEVVRHHGEPSRPSPPTTRTPRAWPRPPSSSSTRCSTR